MHSGPAVRGGQYPSRGRKQHVQRSIESSLVGRSGRRIDPGADHHRRRHGLPPPLPGTPCAGAASGREPLLPVLAVAHHGHDHQGMGCHPPQAPCEVRDRGRSPQPALPRHQQGPVRGRRALREGIAQAGDDAALRPRHARRLDGAQRLHAVQQVGHRAARSDRPRPLRPRAGRDHLRRAAFVDPVLGRRRDQRRGPLFRLPQLPDRRRQHEHRALGGVDRRRGAAQQPPRVSHLGQVLAALVRGSTSAGATSASSSPSGSPMCASARRR